MSKGTDIRALIKVLVQGGTLSEEESFGVFELIMTGQATDAQIGSLLTSIEFRAGGPTIDELVGAARVMRKHVVRVEVPDGREIIDTCGTGGVGGVTFNVSTTAAIIAAGGGACVAKHGSTSVTSKSGSAQVLEALGVKITVEPGVQTKCLAEAGICFCFAVSHHPAMKHAVGPRKELGIRTIFNLLGPLTNPAGAKRQLLGVANLEMTEKMANVLKRLGGVRAMVVHGDNQDDIATTGPTQITSLKDGSISTEIITPGDLGISRAKLADLAIDDVQSSARMVQRVLTGEGGAIRDVAVLNAAAGLVVAEIASDLADGIEKAKAAIDSGKAAETLEKLIEITNAE